MMDLTARKLPEEGGRRLALEGGLGNEVATGLEATGRPRDLPLGAVSVGPRGRRGFAST